MTKHEELLLEIKENIVKFGLPTDVFVGLTKACEEIDAINKLELDSLQITMP